MEIYVLDIEMARKRIPEKPELLIGILNSKPPLNVPAEVIPSSLRLDYLTYVFDDIDERYEDYVLIDEKIAREILTDFSEYKDRIESLAIHCQAGLGRSPAVASALNDVFDLGSQEDYFELYKDTINRIVYMAICRKAFELGISGKEPVWR